MDEGAVPSHTTKETITMTTTYSVYALAQNTGDWSGLENENTGVFGTLEEAQKAFENYTHNAVYEAGTVTVFLSRDGEVIAQKEAVGF